MTFEEWWKTLTTREQNQTTYESLRVAFEAGQTAEREECAKIFVQVMNGGIQAYAAAIRARGNK